MLGWLFLNSMFNSTFGALNNSLFKDSSCVFGTDAIFGIFATFGTDDINQGFILGVSNSFSTTKSKRILQFIIISDASHPFFSSFHLGPHEFTDTQCHCIDRGERGCHPSLPPWKHSSLQNHWDLNSCSPDDECAAVATQEAEYHECSVTLNLQHPTLFYSSLKFIRMCKSVFMKRIKHIYMLVFLTFAGPDYCSYLGTNRHR